MRSLLWLFLLAGCDTPRFDFDRMLNPAEVRPYEPSGFFPGGRAMQTPPAGTVPRTTPPPATPPPRSVALVERGRDRFNIYCALCHGLRGDGQSPVAANTELRRPPSLVDAESRARPPARVVQIISEGYGLMPAYAADLPVRDRWAVAAYLEALQLSREVSLDSLPPELRAEAHKALP